MSFMDKVVLITGAGSGMGAAISLHFAKLNAGLCLVDINSDNLSKVCKECEQLTKKKPLKLVADLSKEESVKICILNTLEKYSKIDVIVNCAGIHGAGSVKDADIVKKYDKVMAVNLRSIVAMTSFATPALIESKGCVVNISSIASNLASMNMLPYNLSKAGVTHFTKCAALELAKDGVRINCISPGPVKTNLLVNSGMTETQHQAFWDAMGQSTPLKRVAKVEEIAELVAFLASEKACSITGSDFVVDCGFLLGGTADLPGIAKN